MKLLGRLGWVLCAVSVLTLGTAFPAQTRTQETTPAIVSDVEQALRKVTLQLTQLKQQLNQTSDSREHKRIAREIGQLERDQQALEQLQQALLETGEKPLPIEKPQKDQEWDDQQEQDWVERRDSIQEDQLPEPTT